MPRATGPFEVSLKPLPVENQPGDGNSLGRMSIEKQYHGDLEGVGTGQMLTGGTAIKTSAAYVAIEQVAGSLKGREGSFILQHTGTMTRGAPSLAIIVVPDSGTDQLEGLKGTMEIIIEAGKHSYQLDYTLSGRG